MASDDIDIRRQINQLTRELNETRVTLHRLRAQSQLTRVAVVIAVLGATVAGVSITAQGRATRLGPVLAPFRVVDEGGRTVFEATESLSAPSITVGRVSLGTGASGHGYVMVRRPDDSDAIAIGQYSGNSVPAMYVFNKDGGLAAAMGVDPKGAGLVLVNNEKAQRVLDVHGDGGLRLLSPAGKVVGSLGLDARNTNGSVLGLTGLIQLFDLKGRTMVEAGTTEAGEGVVWTGPGRRCVGYGAFKVPDCIRGIAQ